MFCYKCGKELQENSVFCTWCGTKQEPILNSVPSAASANSANSVPTPSETPRSNLDSVQEQPTVSVPQPVEGDTAGAAVPQPVSESPEISELQESPGVSAEAPQPAPEPVQFTQPEQPMPEPSQQTAEKTIEVPMNEPQVPEKVQKYYTGVHLAICLVITGIMAAAAGVFAGLYFSVIM